MSDQLTVFAIFHLNLMFSSIEEDQRSMVVERCYWPLLRLVERGVLLGIELSGVTLELIGEIDPEWVARLGALARDGRCEIVGSGYAQVIAPLAPAGVNEANLRFGLDAYESVLGVRPTVALVNEQAFSSGLVPLYLDAGFRAIVTDWDNPFQHHPEWDPEWRYLPQRALGPGGERIPVLWSTSITFQQFQRHVQGVLSTDEYADYLQGHLAERHRAFAVYGNDAEVFDFRPGRFHTEPPIESTREWTRIDDLFARITADARYRVVAPTEVLHLLDLEGAGNDLVLTSPEDPVPVKKQAKYNITRWAVTGRDDAMINGTCHRIHKALVRGGGTEDQWRELCYLWSSDFRTHITNERWEAFLDRLRALEEASPACKADVPTVSPRIPADAPRDGNTLLLNTSSAAAQLDIRRGLAIKSLRFARDGASLCGTLPHGFYDHIAMAADFFTGHLVFEAAGRSKITDLVRVEPIVERADGFVEATATIETPLGSVRKRVRAFESIPMLEVDYELDWPVLPLGTLRLGIVTLDPRAFDRSTLAYRTVNGGRDAEAHRLTRAFDHGEAVSSLVSAHAAVGMTEGWIEIGDASRSLRVEILESSPMPVGLVSFRDVGGSYFFRVSFSIAEMDDTRMTNAVMRRDPTRFGIRITPGRGIRTNEARSGI